MIHTETASTYPDLVGEKVISGLEDDEMAHSLNDYVRAIYKLDVSDAVTPARSMLLHRLIRSFDLDMGMAWNRSVPSSFAVSHQFKSFITDSTIEQAQLRIRYSRISKAEAIRYLEQPA
jgi:hypothetical protein